MQKDSASSKSRKANIYRIGNYYYQIFLSFLYIHSTCTCIYSLPIIPWLTCFSALWKKLELIYFGLAFFSPAVKQLEDLSFNYNHRVVQN